MKELERRLDVRATTNDQKKKKRQNIYLSYAKNHRICIAKYLYENVHVFFFLIRTFPTKRREIII